MRTIFASLLMLSIVSCSKQNQESPPISPDQLRANRIATALTTANPERLKISEKILLSEFPLNYYHIKEVIAVDKKTGFISFGYIIQRTTNIDGEQISSKVAPWGTYTGWLLMSDGCYHHGTFFWSGTRSNYVFNADSDPMGDSYIGNEPRCMSEDEFDSFA